MAAKLQADYGFSHDNVKVLLGGWYVWQDANWTDPVEYPIDTTPHSIAFAARRQET